MSSKYNFQFEQEYLINDNEVGFYFKGQTTDGRTVEIGNMNSNTFANLLLDDYCTDWKIYIDDKCQYVGFGENDITPDEVCELLSCSKVGEQFLDTYHALMEFESTTKVEPFQGGYDLEYEQPYVSELNVLVDTEEEITNYQYRLIPHYRREGMEFDGNDEDKIDEGLKQLVTILPHVDLQKLTVVCYN